MKLLGLLLILGSCGGFAQECCEPNYYLSDYYPCREIPRTRSDNIPQTHVAYADDRYLTGYVQALVDMHYYEFQLKVLVKEGIAYVYNLPCEDVLANSILCFIADIPCICAVEPVDCPLEEYYEVGVCEMPPPACQIPGIWLPQNNVLFVPLVADPRQVCNSAALRFNDDVIGKHVGAVSFGDEFPLYRWCDLCWFYGEMEVGVEPGIFAVFDLDNAEACMVNTDFFVAAFLSYAVEAWSFRFRLWHLSSHLGDEFLISHPGYDRRNLSDEGTDLFASYWPCQAIRVYAGLGYIISRDHTFPEDPLYAEGGMEIRAFGVRSCYDKLYIQPFFAMHFRSWEEHNYSIDQTYALGVEYSKIQGVGRKFRIFGEYHNGFSREGQFVKERCDYVAVRISYSF